MKRAIAQEISGTSMYMPVSEEVAVALESTRNERHVA